MWKIILTEADGESLQKDLDIIQKWSEKWLLKFNSKKCVVLHLGNKNIKCEYSMVSTDGARKTLQSVNEEKDLGVIICDDLKVTRQCAVATQKAMKILLGLIKRNFKKLDEATFKVLYCSYVRPHLEYCIQAWSPYLEKDIKMIEEVQERATKVIPGFKFLTYEQRLKKLDLSTLQQRRKRGDLIEAYKIISGKEKIDPGIFFTPSHTKNLRGNRYKLFKKTCNLQLRDSFFSQRVVNDWNNLPDTVVSAPTVNSFKNRLDKFLKNERWNNSEG